MLRQRCLGRLEYIVQSGTDHKKPVLHIRCIWIVMHPGKYMDLIFRRKKGIRVVHTDLDIFSRRPIPRVYPDLIRQTRSCGIGLKNILNWRRRSNGYLDILSSIKSAGMEYNRRIPLNIHCPSNGRYFSGHSLCFQADYGHDDRRISLTCHLNRNIILLLEFYGFRKYLELFDKLIRRENKLSVYLNCSPAHTFLTAPSALYRNEKLLADILNGKTLDHPLRFDALTGKEFRAEDKSMPIGARNKKI